MLLFLELKDVIRLPGNFFESSASDSVPLSKCLVGRIWILGIKMYGSGCCPGSYASSG